MLPELSLLSVVLTLLGLAFIRHLPGERPGAAEAAADERPGPAAPAV